MTVHLVGFPHTRLDEAVPTCAYTAKVAKLRRMDIGRDLVVYGTEGADVELLNEFERRSLFGDDDANRLPFWPDEDRWRLFNARAVAQITERAVAGDVVMLAGGYSQRYVEEALKLSATGLLFCEPFVGYEGITSEFCAFESHAWRHHVYGLKGIKDGRWSDAVIPNYFDPDEFYLGEPDDYLLFVGRVTQRKGVEVAVRIAEAAGTKLVIAGPGGVSEGNRLLGDFLYIESDSVSYVGPVGPVERADLMSRARALLTPTFYLEPFGGVAVEAMMCGTPVVSSDFGAFTETVENGLTGQRFVNFQGAIDALEVCDTLDREAIRERAIERYSLAAVAPMFRDWLHRLDTTRIENGWYAYTPRERNVRE